MLVDYIISFSKAITIVECNRLSVDDYDLCCIHVSNQSDVCRSTLFLVVVFACLFDVALKVLCDIIILKLMVRRSITWQISTLSSPFHSSSIITSTTQQVSSAITSCMLSFLAAFILISIVKNASTFSCAIHVYNIAMLLS